MKLNGGCEAIRFNRSISSMLGGSGLAGSIFFLPDFLSDSIVELSFVNDDFDLAGLLYDLISVMILDTTPCGLQNYSNFFKPDIT
ncbi:MAG: hypothetical protein M3N30_00610 [Bacteroidota bacterium]|nr:hypothetical protein [Bacteroidota bacterium]